MLKKIWFCCALALMASPLAGFAAPPSNAPSASTSVKAPPVLHDGQHDFDFEFGSWKTELSYLQHPLTGSTSWVKYSGTTEVRKVWGGKANLVELEVDGSAGHLELASLRLYNPETHQWSLNVTSSRSGVMTDTPTIGEFKDGRGVFYDQEDIGGRTAIVRFVITVIDVDTIHFEQAFSGDYGKTWELNWVATDTRIK